MKRFAFVLFLAALSCGFAKADAPPAAPAQSSPAAVSHSVTLTWTLPSPTPLDLSNVNIYRCAAVAPATTCTPKAPALATVGKVTTYTDTAVMVGATYEYYATSVCPAAGATCSGESAPSNTVPATIPAPPPLVIGTTTLPDGQVGVTYSASLAATGGNAPYAWSETAFAPGLILSASTGAITGTPTLAGNFTATVTVTDSTNAKVNASIKQAVKAAAVPPLMITNTSLPAGQVGDAYSGTVVPAGGTPPYTFKSSTMAPGLTLSASGIISGTPTTSGTFTEGITVTDSTNPTLTTPASFSITVAPAPAPVVVVISPSSTTMQSAAQLNFSATVTGSTNAAVTWTSTGGTINAAGLFTAPTTVGPVTVTVTATSQADSTKSAVASVMVVAPVPPAKFNTGDTFQVMTPGAVRLNVRGTASATGAVVGTVANGSTGTVMGPEVNGFWPIQAGTVSGFVSDSYVVKTAAQLAIACAWNGAIYQCNVSNVQSGQSVSVTAGSSGQSAVAIGVAP